MLFASTELAARIERAERSLIEDSARAARGARPGLDAFVRPVAGGAACYAGPGSPLNKVAGLGFGGAPTDAELDDVEREYARRACPVQVELGSLADPALGATLTARGYRLVGFENVLGLAPGADDPTSAPHIDVRPCSADDLDEWIDLVVDGFAAPDVEGVASHESFDRAAIEGAIRDMAGAAGMTRYIARVDGRAAGAASMRTHEGVAHLCGAATLPPLRRRGVQTALLARRLRDAATRGCDLAVMTTLPGSKSQENAQRRGFAPLYTRAVLVKQP